MGIFKKYLDTDDKAELKARQRQIDEQVLIVKSLEIAKLMWLRAKYPKYGLDGNKNWGVNTESGKITEGEKPKKEK